MNIFGKNLYTPIGSSLIRQLSSVKLPKVSHLPANKDTSPSSGTCMKIIQTPQHAPMLKSSPDVEKDFSQICLILKKLPDITENQKQYLSKNLGIPI